MTYILLHIIINYSPVDKNTVVFFFTLLEYLLTANTILNNSKFYNSLYLNITEKLSYNWNIYNYLICKIVRLRTSQNEVQNSSKIVID